MADESEVQLYTEREAARYLTSSRRTLQGWRRKGKGPVYTRVGRLIRYRLSDLEEFLCSGLSNKTPEPGQ